MINVDLNDETYFKLKEFVEKYQLFNSVDDYVNFIMDTITEEFFIDNLSTLMRYKADDLKKHKVFKKNKNVLKSNSNTMQLGKKYYKFESVLSDDEIRELRETTNIKRKQELVNSKDLDIYITDDGSVIDRKEFESN